MDKVIFIRETLSKSDTYQDFFSPQIFLLRILDHKYLTTDSTVKIFPGYTNILTYMTIIFMYMIGRNTFKKP